MKKIICLIMCLLLMPTVLGIDLHEISYVVDKNLVQATHTIISDEPIELLVPQDAYNFIVLADDKVINFSLAVVEGNKQIRISHIASHEISIYYLSSSFIEKVRHTYFVGTLRTTQATQELIVRLTLPEGALLARPLNALNPAVTPHPHTVETSGRELTITWLEQDKEPGDTFLMFVVYEEEKGFFWQIIVAVLMLLLLTGLLNYYFARHKKVEHIKETSFSHLLEPEQAIVNVLVRAKEQTMWQKELQIAVGFTKSKLSRTIRNMQERGLIKKTPYGATNKITLITDGNKKEE